MCSPRIQAYVSFALIIKMLSRMDILQIISEILFFSHISRLFYLSEMTTNNKS